MIILNCDYDESPETNGAQLLRKHLAKLGVKIVIKNVFQGDLPSEQELKSAEGIIVTGSRASVYEKHAWIQKLTETLKKIDELGISTLAICFGFQIVTQTFGGQVEKSGSFWEGFKPVKLDKHPLFKGLPEKCLVYHSHGDVAKKLPSDAIVIATAPHAVQAFQLRKFLCVQFHPEITAQTATAMAERDEKDLNKILNEAGENYSLPVKVVENFVRITAINAYHLL